MLILLPLSLEGWDYTGVCQYTQVYGMLGIEPYWDLYLLSIYQLIHTPACETLFIVALCR